MILYRGVYVEQKRDHLPGSERLFVGRIKMTSF